MNLVKDEIQPYEKVVMLQDFNGGVCLKCGTDIEYLGGILAIQLIDTLISAVYMPLTLLRCACCSTRITSLVEWKDLNVTAEFALMNKGENYGIG